MGEVYRARDARLKREVAVKVLPATMSADADRLRRFEQEAEAASALNHPNILSIFDIGTEDGAPYIVSELLEGETLRAKLAGGAFQPKRAIGHALQIAQGLAAAHEKGIAHRDLKPENIFVTSDGRVKILDFGLAKLTQPEGKNPSLTSLPTDAPGTEPGVVLGTLGYMAPEQVRGKGADARSDIFSFGAILYEMLSGRRAFQGETAADTISAILNQDPPDLSETNRRIPESLDRIVHHCLEKSPESRFQSSRDIAFDLEAISGTSLAAPVVTAQGAPWGSRVKRLLPWLLLPIVALVAFGVGRRLTGGQAGTAGGELVGEVRKLTIQPGIETYPSLSPDGSTVVYEAGPPTNTDIYLQRVGGHNPINLTKDCDKNDGQPALSPTGDKIAFSSDCGGGGIFVMGATGENLRRLTDFGFNPAWSPDEKEIAVAGESFLDPYSRTGLSSLWIVDVASGQKRKILDADAVQPAWSPHGDRIAYWGLLGNRGQRDIFTIAARGEKAAPVKVTDDQPTDWNPIWSADGRSLFFASDRGGSMNLWRIGIDERSGRVAGAPQKATLPADWVGPATLGRDGRHLVYEAKVTLPGIIRIPFDPAAGKVDGPPTEIFRSSLPMLPFEVSPDGEWIVFASGGSRQDLFLIRKDGTGLRQITDDPYRDRNVAWTRDGKQVLFMSDRSGVYETWSIRTDGSGLTQLTHTPTGKATWWPVFSPDGTRFAAGDGGNTYVYTYDGSAVKGREAIPPLGGDHWFNVRDWSPDGKLLAAGRSLAVRGDGIVIYDFSTRQYRQLNDFGNLPRFLPDSRRLLFVDQSTVWLIDSETKESRKVFSAPPNSQLPHFVLAPDGRSIYALQTTIESDIWEATLNP
jgi:eukaryotic-like serine/threonine-protein kinase